MSSSQSQGHEMLENRKRKREDADLDDADHSAGLDEANCISNGRSGRYEPSNKNYSPESTGDRRGRSPSREWRRYQAFAAEELAQRVNRRDSTSFRYATSPIRTFSSSALYSEARGESDQAFINAQEPDFKYKPLLSGAIRILTVHPSRFSSDDLNCSLTIREKDETSPYEALSYVWGTDPASCPLRIRNPDGGFDNLWITMNLTSALKQLRYPLSPRKFWVDTICIYS